ncbi:class I SAM-dependent methyltransferase [Nocardioides sp.]|uniref:class I SAM-dependent methyltransferase n=1 Tax=Nocardioides sp. TaxID=35761 RepID=UPI0026359882|nr:class I SAM-dependent methyltransferase [Nocardioides sp.]
MSDQTFQETINAYWTDRAPAYDDYQQRPERRQADVEAWREIWAGCLPPAPARVLDLGTGSGHVAFVVAGLGHEVTGIDLADGMLERAREHAAALPDGARMPTFCAGDAVAPPFEAETFDAIVGRYVAWTLRDPDAAVQAWLRLLRPGGLVALVDSTWYPHGGVDLYDERPEGALRLAEATSIEATAEVLRAGGLREVAVTPLPTIEALDRRFGVAPGHQVRQQFLITGRR